MAVCSLALLTGCPDPPGNNGNGNTNNPGNANTNSGSNTNINSGNPGGGTPGAPVSMEQRNATIDSIDEVLATITPDDLDDVAAAVSNKLRSDTAIERVGTNPDGSVWARFTDGRPLVVALNHPIPEEILTALLAEPPATPRPAPPRPDASSLRFESTARAGSSAGKPMGRMQGGAQPSIPSGKRAYLFNNYGPSLSVNTHIGILEGWLEEAGYQVANSGVERGTIDNLRHVSSASVFYLAGLASYGYVEQADSGAAEREVYAIGTATLRAPDGSTDANYEIELEEQAVGYIATPTIVLLPGTGQRFGRSSFKHYFITDRFVDMWWRFVPGAQVYIDADSSMEQEDFSNACFRYNAGAFIGWTGSVRPDDTLESAQYYFSRTLGALEGYGGAKVTKETPNQRPFSTTQILLIDMEQRQRTTPHAIAFQQPTTLNRSFTIRNLFDESGQAALLDIVTVDGLDEPILRPSISNLNMDDDELNILTHETGTLGIGGDFGADPTAVSVRVGVFPAEVRQFGPGSLLCHVPPEASGSVEVEIRGHKSNVRELTLWSGTASVTETLQGITRTLEIEVLIRGDVQNYRTDPGGEPTEWAAGFSGVCIPSLSGIMSHSVMGFVHCQSPGLADDEFRTAPVATYPDFQPIGEDGTGFYFRRGSPGVHFDEEVGVYTGNFVWGATIADGEEHRVNCTLNPRVQNELFRGPQGGVEVTISHGNYNINVTQPNGEGISSTLTLTTANPPDDNDPR